MHNNMPSMQWLFRVAAKAENGGGHVSRSLLLAREMKAGVTFSVCEGSPYVDMIESQGFKVVSVSQEDVHYDGIWLDVYDDDYDSYRSKTKCLAIIEDHKDLYDKADIYVRPYPGNFSARQSAIELKGLDFSFLEQKFFSKRGNAVASNAYTITLFMGRYDSVNATTRILEVLNSLPIHIFVQVVTGGQAAHLSEVKSYLSNDFHHKYQQYIDLPDLCEIFAGSDLLVLSGGVALLEACAVGCPALVLNIAENQFMLSEYLSANGAIAYAGRFSQFNPSDFSEMFMQTLSFEKRQELSRSAQKIVTQSGANLVAEKLLRWSMERALR